jgi:hypothetical protein
LSAPQWHIERHHRRTQTEAIAPHHTTPHFSNSQYCTYHVSGVYVCPRVQEQFHHLHLFCTGSESEGGESELWEEAREIEKKEVRGERRRKREKNRERIVKYLNEKARCLMTLYMSNTIQNNQQIQRSDVTATRLTSLEAFMFAPFCSRSSTISTLPSSAAPIRAVASYWLIWGIEEE